MGDDGPFQRFERSEISQDEFYREFGARLSDVESGNKAYRVYCKRAGIGALNLLYQIDLALTLLRVLAQNARRCRPRCRLTARRCVFSFPSSSRHLRVLADAQHLPQLWGMMMAPALEPDELVVTAINRLRGKKNGLLALRVVQGPPLSVTD